MKAFRFIIAACIFLQLPVSPLLSQPDARMELVLLGTGYPYPNAERAGPSCAIIVGDKTFIVDAGRGTVMRLAALDVAWDSIAAAVVTHLHSDHIDGLPDLFHSTWQFGGGRPFELYGPEGIRNVSDSIMNFYRADIHIRRDLTEKLPPEGAKINCHEVTDGIVYLLPGGVRMTAFAVDHHPVDPAFGYRFDMGPHAIVVSGDTRPNANLLRFAKGADILVHEAYVYPGLPEDRESYRWTIYDYHTSAEEAGEVAEKVNAKILVLTHLIPANAPEGLFLEEAKKSFHGRVIVGKDLMRIGIPTDPDREISQ
jgi:ribonuclease Z